MFFNDLGCFEIESQSFTPLTPSAHEFDKFLSGPLSSTGVSAIINDCSGNINSTLGSDSTAKVPTKTKPRSKALKKRTTCLALEVNQPRPRTPRRKLNCGNAFEDVDSQYSTPSSSQCFSSVGTPSNFSTEMSRMWGDSDLDFTAANSYVDTFLDLPTPKSIEMPTNTGLQQQQQNPNDDLSFPKLIRTTSIEQEGLSHFFQQATLNGSSQSDDGSPSSSANSSPLHSRCDGYDHAHHPSAHHVPIKKNQIDLNSPYSQAVMGTVDEYFVKMMPLPSPLPGARRNSLLLSTSAPTGSSPFAASGGNFNRLLSATPRGTSAILGSSYLRTPRGPNGEYSFDPKTMPEFETLLDEYKFTDIDQELDSFYLDTIESFGGGGELDLASH